MILLDTHIVIRLVERPRTLSRAARKAIARESATGGLAVASISLMELAQVAAHGRLRLSGTPGSWLRELVADARLSIRELTTDIAAVAAFLPPDFPPDPFDRMIAATAIVERMPLVTTDERIRRSGVVKTIW